MPKVHASVTTVHHLHVGWQYEMITMCTEL